VHEPVLAPRGEDVAEDRPAAARLLGAAVLVAPLRAVPVAVAVGDARCAAAGGEVALGVVVGERRSGGRPDVVFPARLRRVDDPEGSTVGNQPVLGKGLAVLGQKVSPS